jgi:exopolysaccharide biosynthesis polyprenyl glycosylphosphotransferase
VLYGSVGHGERAGMAVLLFAGLILGRGSTRRLVTAALPPERCLVAGSTHDSKELAERFERSKTFKARVVGRVEAETELSGNPFEDQDRLLAMVRRDNAERLIVIPSSNSDLNVARAANALGLKVSIVPRLFDAIGTSFALDDLIGLTLLGMRRPRLTGSSTIVKRINDLVLGSIITLLVAPVMALIAIAVRLDSPGPSIYRQRRIGKNGDSFTIYKFRSMTDNTHAHRSHLKQLNEADGLFKITDDPRITRVGRILRKTSLDELPQIFNVLRGEMSLVGPRPLVPEEDMLLDGWARFRYRVLPGMTGPWQLGTAARFSIEDMASLDYVYVTNWSLWTDIKILVRTVVYVLGLHGR